MARGDNGVGSHVLLVDGDGGVHFGMLLSRHHHACIIDGYRQPWYSNGEVSLESLARDGVTAKGQCLFTKDLGMAVITDVREVIRCTPEAAATITGIPPGMESLATVRTREDG